MKIAVASSSGEMVDLHFGLAETFYIYDVEDSTIELLESFEVSPYSSGDKSHDFDEERFNAVHLLLKDCQKVFCTKIGERPKQELRQRGIEAVECDCSIESLPL